MKLFCGICEAIQEVVATKTISEYVIKDTKVVATITILKCQHCGEEVYDKATEIANDILLFDEYKRINGLLTSHEIISIRKQFGLSQESLAKIMGFGLKTIARYENGAIQDSSHDNLLRLVSNVDNFTILWQRNYHKLNPHENSKISRRVPIKEKVKLLII